jgi:hypothetical protein
MHDLRVVKRLPARPHTIRRVRVAYQAIHFASPFVAHTVVGHEENAIADGTKISSGSWRHSAETEAKARQSKVIGGPFYDCEHGAGLLGAPVWTPRKNAAVMPVERVFGAHPRLPEFCRQKSSSVQLLPENGQHVGKNSRPAQRERCKGECHAKTLAAGFKARTAQSPDSGGGG